MPEFENLDHLSEHYACIPIPTPIAFLAMVQSKQTGFEYQLLVQPRYDEQTKFVMANQFVIQYLRQGKDEYVTVKGEWSRELDKNETHAKNLFAMIHAAKEIDPLVESLLVPIRESFDKAASKRIGTLPPAQLIEYPLCETYRWDLRLAIRVLAYATGEECPLTRPEKIVTQALPERLEPSAFLPIQSVLGAQKKGQFLPQESQKPPEEKPRDSQIFVTRRMPARGELEEMVGINKKLTTK